MRWTVPHVLKRLKRGSGIARSGSRLLTKITGLPRWSACIGRPPITPNVIPIYMYVCVFVCMYIYIYIYIYNRLSRLSRLIGVTAFVVRAVEEVDRVRGKGG